MHKIASIFAVSALALALAACGGSNDNSFVGSGSSSSSSSSTASSAASVTVASSSATIPADGSASATVSALVRDSNNVALQGVTVAFAATAGSLAITNATTDATGTATATLTASGAAAGSSITVTASAGTASGKASIGVVASQQTLTLLTSSPQIPSDGSKPATIQAVVRDANNTLLSGVVIKFSASSGAVAAVQTTAGSTAGVPAGTTDTNGEAWAQLSTPGDPSNRTITVTATIGSSTTSATVTVAVIGTKLTVSGPTSLILGNSGTYSVSLTDSGGNGISGQAVALTSANGNTLSAASVTTDTTGHATFQLTASKSGDDTVSASALGLTASQAVAVSSQSFEFTAPTANSNVPISTSQQVTLVWSNAGTAVVGQTVSFSTTRGTFSGGASTTTATTDSTGTAKVTLSATTAGPAVISATATGVSTQLPIEFIATTPATIDLQASPTTVPTQGSSTVTAIVRDAQNNLVEGQTVDFQLTDKTGGTISVATATTDVYGQAQTVYNATTVASGANGVQITATVAGLTATTYITVGGQAVFLSLGTGNTISQLPAGCGSSGTLCTQFSMPFSVLAIDSGGNPVPGATVTFTVHAVPPPASIQTIPPNPAPPYTTVINALQTNSDQTQAGYAKGCWIWGGSSWVQTGGNGTTCLATTPQTVLTYCLNEDVNGTGILTYDANGNGKLDPGDVATVNPGKITTDSTGSGQVTVVYPQDHALWVQVVLTASASVNGTQSSTSSTFWLPMLASDLTSQTVDPPGITSPYGIANSCASPN
ncbi:MAG: beta strand repeat-containing protein [Steroidobacteraceae bacterium]